MLHVRAACRTDDGCIIYTGYRRSPTIGIDMPGRILMGEAVGPTKYYSSTTQVFETASEEYR
jgi:hypothetical protein